VAIRISVQLSGYLWRPLTASEDDTDFVLRVRNTPQARAAFFEPVVTREDHLRFLRRAEERDEINWIVERGGERVGATGIYNIDRKHRRAMARVAVTAPEVHLLNSVVSMHVVFEVLGLNKLHGEALVSNAVSNMSLERLGTVKEGVLREHVFVNGEPRDVYCYGLLASDWRRLKAGIVARFGEPKVSHCDADDVC
jgi:UDP-4-amino-4,6-dideoxy-N-acetyl-beta-L-altrosamine N-acetyltransferase